MTRLILYFATLVLGLLTANAQQVTGRILDSETNESIPYATIRVGETDLISNDDGYFTLSGENANESALLSISFIGYGPQKMSVSQLKSNNNIIKLALVSYDIGGVYVSNEKPDPKEVMKLVNENLSKNYTASDYQYTVFTRTSTSFKPKKFDFEIKKSTGLSKSDLKEINNEVKSLTSKMMSSPSKEFTDKLMTLYKSSSSGKAEYKLDLIKATQLRDESRSTNFDDLEKQGINVFHKVMDTTKFYRIKSGLIGSRDTISFSKEYNQKKKSKKDTKEENNRLKGAKNSLTNFLSGNSFLGKDLEFVKNTDIYTYTYVEATYLGDDLVYVIDFKPRKNKAKYEGRLYINESDYAVVRADYKLGKGKKLESLNLKLLLGIKVAENVHNGVVLYKKNKHNDTYYLHYASEESGQYFYLHRPIKFIELADKDKDVVAFDFKVEGDNLEKVEFLNLASKPSSEAEFNSVKEKEFQYQTLKKYDPNIWKGYNIIEPLEEMKKFEVVE